MRNRTQETNNANIINLACYLSNEAHTLEINGRDRNRVDYEKDNRTWQKRRPGIEIVKTQEKRKDNANRKCFISPVIITSQCIYSVLFVSKNKDEYINNGNCIANEVETSAQMSSFHHFKTFPRVTPVTCKTDCFPFPQPRGDWTIETK